MKIFIFITFCLFNLVSAISQNIITGNVSDITGSLPFANVVISGTDIGIVADAKGYFSIETKKGDILIISYVGCVPKHISIENTKHLDISLESDSLDEVVIVGYGMYSKSHTICCGLNRTIYCEFSESLGAQKTGKRFDVNPNTIYPNPSSSGYFTLNFLETYESVKISVVTVTGQVIFSKSYTQPTNNINIHLSRFSTGIYILNTVADNERLVAQKIIRS